MGVPGVVCVPGLAGHLGPLQTDRHWRGLERDQTPDDHDRLHRYLR